MLQLQQVEAQLGNQSEHRGVDRSHQQRYQSDRHQARGKSEQQTLDEHLEKQSGTARPERGAKREIVATGGEARQHQIGQIGRRHQQDQQHQHGNRSAGDHHLGAVGLVQQAPARDRGEAFQSIPHIAFEADVAGATVQRGTDGLHRRVFAQEPANLDHQRIGRSVAG